MEFIFQTSRHTNKQVYISFPCR